MSLVSSLILLCLKPCCDSLSCEWSNLILRLLMLKYIIISDASEDFTLLITALNQIGKLLLITRDCTIVYTPRLWGGREVWFREVKKYCPEFMVGDKKKKKKSVVVGAGGPLEVRVLDGRPRARQLVRACVCVRVYAFLLLLFLSLTGLCSL